MVFHIKGNELIKYNGEESQVTIPEEVTVIGDDALQEHKHMEGIQLPKGLEKIGKWSFSCCTALQCVDIPWGVTRIGMSAFRSCTRMHSVNIPDSVECIMGKAFEFCKSLKQVRIPGKMTVIAEKTFSNCAGLREVTLEEGLIEIGEWSFEGCSGIKSLKFPDSVEIIGEGAFLDCTDLMQVSFGKNIRKIGVHAFEGTAWLENRTEKYVQMNRILIKYQGEDRFISVPPEISVIGCGAFEYNRTLDTVVLQEGVKEIGEKAFYECTTLSVIHIPASIRVIHPNAFNSCRKLCRVMLPGHLLKEAATNELWQLHQEVYPDRITDYFILLPTESNKIRFQDVINCGRDGISINYTAYEEGFPKITELDNKANLAITRLLFPFQLTKAAAAGYTNYLKDNNREVTEYFLRSGSYIYLKAIAALTLLPEDNIDELIQLSVEIRNVEITGFLLAYKNDRIGYNDDKYQL